MEWLKARLAEVGKKPAHLARHLDIAPARVYEMIDGNRRFKPTEIHEAAEFLEWTDSQLIARIDGRPMPDAPEPLPPVVLTTPVHSPPGRPDLPVWASAAAGDDGAMILTSAPIDMIHRRGQTKGAFAFYVLGDSMSPVIEHGDQLVVDPAQPPRAGNDCVFVSEEADGTMLAMVKRLLRAHPDRWRVRQFNEPRDFDLSRSKWAKAFKVVEKRYG